MHGLDEARFPGVVSQGLAQLEDGLVEAGHGHRNPAPRRVQKLVPGQELPGPRRHVLQELPRLGPQRDGLIPAPQPLSVRVQPEGRELDRLARVHHEA